MASGYPEPNAVVIWTVEPERLHAELVAVDDVARADSGTHVLTTFDVENGKAGVGR